MLEFSDNCPHFQGKSRLFLTISQVILSLTDNLSQSQGNPKFSLILSKEILGLLDNPPQCHFLSRFSLTKYHVIKSGLKDTSSQLRGLSFRKIFYYSNISLYNPSLYLEIFYISNVLGSKNRIIPFFIWKFF